MPEFSPGYGLLGGGILLWTLVDLGVTFASTGPAPSLNSSRSDSGESCSMAGDGAGSP